MTAVPVTLFITMLLFFSWVTSLILTHQLGRHVGLGVPSVLVSGAILARREEECPQYQYPPVSPFEGAEEFWLPE